MNKKRVLIVDDEEHIRLLTRLSLEAVGYEVGEAESGMEAFAILGSSDSWDVILLDQRMPEMMGTDVLRRLKVLAPNSAVIMMTAFASIELAVDAMKLGATDFLRKPMTPEMLRNAVAAALARSSPSNEQLTADTILIDAAETHATEAGSPVRYLTLNGFEIVAQPEMRLPDKYSFTVIGPNNESHEVVVVIDDEVIDYVERMTHRRLPVQSSFWAIEAERLLAEYLWNNGSYPVGHELRLADIDRDKLAIAERWSE
jgi:FixJ family two-component response regulator